MKTVIMAAGKGTRLLPLTETTPKPLIEINGKSILEYTFEALPDKVNQIILVIGYKGEMIRDKFGQSYNDKEIIYVEQKELRGTYDSLKTAENFLDDQPFLVLNGDDIYSKDDLEKLVEKDLAIMLTRVKDPGRFDACVLDCEGNFIGIGTITGKFGEILIYAGAAVLDKKIFNEKPGIGKTGEQLLPQAILSLSNKYGVKSVEANRWFPIGHPEDIEKTKEHLN